MTNHYTPRPGSLTAKVIAHLTRHGGTLTPREMSELFSVPSSSVNNLLQPPRNHGLLIQHAARTRKTCYSLPGSEPTHVPTGPDDTPAPRKARKAAAPVQDDTDAAEDPHDPLPPIAALWSDGDIVLYGLALNADDSTITLQEPRARQLHAFLERVFGPNV